MDPCQHCCTYPARPMRKAHGHLYHDLSCYCSDVIRKSQPCNLSLEVNHWYDLHSTYALFRTDLNPLVSPLHNLILFVAVVGC